IIGSSRYFWYGPEPSELEIGWTFLARAYWGGNYNREMKRLMLDYAFTFVDHVIFRVGTTNLRSRRAIEKIGGVLTDRRKRIPFKENCVENVVYKTKKQAHIG